MGFERSSARDAVAIALLLALAHGGGLALGLGPWALFAAAFVLGVVAGHPWAALLPLPLAGLVLLVTGLADLAGAGCAVCSDGGGYAAGAALLLGYLAVPAAALLAAGALVRALAARAGAGSAP